MTHDRKDVDPGFSASLMRGMTQRRVSRRDLIKYGGATVGTLSLASILAACGGDTAPGSGGQTSGATVDFSAPPGDTINFANWPLYIDSAKDPDTGERIHPSLVSFTEETGIAVNYNDEIQANASFFGELLPQLQAEQDTGRDIIVITNGREFTALTVNGWVTELDPSMRPNFDANAASWAKDPDYDPGNKYSMAWQSGLTGIGYLTEKVSRPVTTMDDLMNPDIVGTSSVGMITGDMPDLVMINLGIDPASSGPAEWQEAADWIQMLKDSGTLRKFYDQGYIDDFTAGNLAASMAWSGDVLYYKIWENKPYEWVVPDGGALLWIDNMMIPANSANPQGAYQLMDYVYLPEIAQMITEWVAYMSPVPAVQDLIAQHATEESGEYAADLADMAENPLLWPDDALLAQTPFGRNLTTDEEREEWDAIFVPISET
ncbi:MAG TPA: spermidine/putrescine ABC transporter substrate-binding protein [Actinomycetota bacterium]|nr:spermidine/putrescine ABC transporter substrate-binding protein [Actinomycetota bacterium]